MVLNTFIKWQKNIEAKITKIYIQIGNFLNSALLFENQIDRAHKKGFISKRIKKKETGVKWFSNKILKVSYKLF